MKGGETEKVALLPAGIVPKMVDAAAACAYLGNISEDLLAVYRKNNWIQPVIKGRYLVAELDRLIDKLIEEREKKSSKDGGENKDTNGHVEAERKPLDVDGTVGAGAEGPGSGLRVVSGGGDSGRGGQGGKTKGRKGASEYPAFPGA